jgi:hypothetical protein
MMRRRTHLPTIIDRAALPRGSACFRMVHALPCGPLLTLRILDVVFRPRVASTLLRDQAVLVPLCRLRRLVIQRADDVVAHRGITGARRKRAIRPTRPSYCRVLTCRSCVFSLIG